MATTPSKYIGVSTIGSTATRKTTLTDLALVKADLLNAFYTLPGENKMRPTFGCLLRKRLFEQYQNTDRQTIIDDVMAVVQADPRVTYVSTSVTDIPYGVVVAVQLQFNQFAVVDTITLQFNNATDALYGITGS